MKKRWYDYLWAVSLTYLVLGFFNILFAWLGLSRDPVPPGRGAVRLWVLQCHADLDCAGSDYDGAVQAPQLVRLLPHGHHDPAHLQGQKRNRSRKIKLRLSTSPPAQPPARPGPGAVPVPPGQAGPNRGVCSGKTGGSGIFGRNLHKFSLTSPRRCGTLPVPVCRAFFLCAFLRDAGKNPDPPRRPQGGNAPIPRSS